MSKHRNTLIWYGVLYVRIPSMFTAQIVQNSTFNHVLNCRIIYVFGRTVENVTSVWLLKCILYKFLFHLFLWLHPWPPFFLIHEALMNSAADSLGRPVQLLKLNMDIRTEKDGVRSDVVLTCLVVPDRQEESRLASRGSAWAIKVCNDIYTPFIDLFCKHSVK